MSLKVVIINKSDSTGGAAVVSLRLMEALRRRGADARMLVVEKLSESEFVYPAASALRIKWSFFTERLRIFIANGFNRSTLFQIDTGETGLPLWKHPLVKKADAVLLNWVNQGMLSLNGVGEILKLGKPVVWTMHDMWCMTGICHHAHSCDHFIRECGECPLLERDGGKNDLSHKVWQRKDNLYRRFSGKGNLFFVAVSSWLFGRGGESSLLGKAPLTVIGNAFDLESISVSKRDRDKIRILFGAARIDDPIKGLPVLKKMTEILKREYPETAAKTELILFGNVKNPDSITGFSVPVRYLGVLKAEDVRKAFSDADIVVSASSFETLPGTLVEAQAYGCIPVSFNRGGQKDIVENKVTGYLADYSFDIEEAGRNLTEGIIWASGIINDPDGRKIMIERMRKNVEQKFSYDKIAGEYLDLIEKMRKWGKI